MNDQNKIYIITSNIEAGALETLPVNDSMILISNNDLPKTDNHFDENKKEWYDNGVTVREAQEYIRENFKASIKSSDIKFWIIGKRKK